MRVKKIISMSRDLVTQSGVCPPFNLYDENGSLINPVNNTNADKPYSPKQTCGKCHDYAKITQGFHFQQGKDEKAVGTFAERYQWVSSPGNYGGNWCSPAPLYNYLSKKSNSSAKEMDMTSFTFITNGCATCHPGGGPLEYDRAGFRYDKLMDSVKYTAGGINNFDGDYFRHTGTVQVLLKLIVICVIFRNMTIKPGTNNWQTSILAGWPLSVQDWLRLKVQSKIQSM